MVEIIRKSHWSTLKTSSTSYWPCPIHIWSSPFAVNSCLEIVFLLLLNNIFHSWPKYFGSFCSDWVPTTHFWCIPNKVLFSSIKENSFESPQRRQWQSSSQQYPPLTGIFLPMQQVQVRQTVAGGHWVHSWLWGVHVHSLCCRFVWHRNSHLKLLLYWDYKG